MRAAGTSAFTCLGSALRPMGERSTAEDGQVRRVGPSVSVLPMTSVSTHLQRVRVRNIRVHVCDTG